VRDKTRNKFAAIQVAFPAKEWDGVKGVYIALHHYSDECLTQDGKDVELVTLHNPDRDGLYKYRTDVAPFTAKTPSLPKRLCVSTVSAQIIFFTAPTMTMDASEERLFALEHRMLQSASPIASTPVLSRARFSSQRDAELARQQSVLDDFGGLQQELKDMAIDEYLHNLGLDRASLEVLQRDHKGLVEKVSVLETSQNALGSAFDMSFNLENLADIDFWIRRQQVNKDVCMAMFGIRSPRLLFAHCLMVRLLFRDLDEGDEESDSLQTSPEVSDEILTIAVKCTPSHLRDEVQRRRSPLGRTPILTNLQEQLLTMFINRTNISLDVLEAVMGVSKATLSRAQMRHLPRFAIVGRILCALPMSASAWHWAAPLSNLNGFDPKALAIVDGKDIEVSDSQNSYALHRKLFSSKVGKPAVRGLILCSANGLIQGATDLVPARATEMDILMAFPRIWERVPASVNMLADKAYRGAHLAMKGSRVLLPAFKPRDGKVFSSLALLHSKQNAQQRYRIEVVNSRLASFKACDDVVDRADMHNLNIRWHASLGLQVYMRPLAQPATATFSTLLSMWYFAQYERAQDE